MASEATGIASDRSWWTPRKSENDPREYRIVKLTNGLVCALVSDKDTDKAGAGMNVRVGSFSDPHDLPGLAHFLEHMLFLGTSEYPDETEYSAYLASHGGKSNAYTSLENTNYYFDVAHEHLQGALSRFSQFFISPLFTASATDREMQAVHSENEKNFQSDHWRIYQVTRSTSNNNHAFSRFSTGNLETLKETPAKLGIDIRKALLQFHDELYCSNRCTLAVIGRESLDTLQQWAEEKFTLVPNKGLGEVLVSPDAHGQASLRKIYHITSVKDLQAVSLLWPLPEQQSHYKVKPSYFVSHLLGHEGCGSLLDMLKKKGWAVGLVAGNSCSQTSFAAFGCSIDLTEEGMNHTEEIIAHVYEYMSLVQKASDDELQRHWTEVKEIREMEFRFKSKEDVFNYVSSLAQNLGLYDLESAVCGPWLMEQWDLPLLRSVIDMVASDNVRIHIVAKQIPEADQTERWFGTRYMERPIPAKLLQKMLNPDVHEDLRLPKPNPFIASDFHIKGVKRPDDSEERRVTAPVLLEDIPFPCWFKQDDVFMVPKANVVVLIESPLAQPSPAAACLSSLYGDLLEDSLTSFAYDAEVAGLWSSVAQSYGYKISIGGYSHKLHILMQEVLRRLRHLEVREDRFAIMKEQMQRDLENFDKDSPYQHGMFAHLTSTEVMWHPHEKKEVLADLTVADLKHHIELLFHSGLKVEMLCHGNLDADQARDMALMVQEIVQPRPLSKNQTIEKRVVNLSPQFSYLFQAATTNNEDRNSACVLTYQIGESTVESSAETEMILQMVKEPFFNQLRTAEQLGYIVNAGGQYSKGVSSVRFLVQSASHPADYLHKRILVYLNEQFKEVLENMTEQEFSTHRQALISLQLQKDRKLDEETMRHWIEISRHRYHFDRANRVIKALKNITKERMLQYYKDYILDGGVSRKMFSCQIFGKDRPLPFVNPELDKTMKVIRLKDGEFAAFRASMPEYPNFWA